MDAVKKQKWIEALRSGKYKQVSGQLQIGNVGYCCLGVYCVVNEIGIENGQLTVVNGETKGYDPLVADIGDKEVSILYGMNDNEHKSFSEIADWIENNL